MLRYLLILAIIATGFSGSARCAPAPGESLLTYETLRSPDQAAQRVQSSAQTAYEHVLDSYRQALGRKPDDAELAIAQCNFIQRFAWSEDLSWGDAASNDLTACESMLDKQFSSNPEAVLFNLEHRFGKPAIAYGEPLLAHCADWTPVQRARLHASLSRAYATAKDEKRAGEEALLAARLDPQGSQLIDAVRYLAKTRRTKEAAALLSGAPLAKNAGLETMRINVAVDVLPATAARDELQRAQRAGMQINAYTRARVLEQSGDASSAQAALDRNAASAANDTPQQRQLRLDIAFDMSNAAHVATILNDEYAKTHNATVLVAAYLHLLNLQPSMLFRLDLLPLTLAFIGSAILVILSPGLVFFPVHYRGTVRQRLGKPTPPLFARIGLRHAWYGLSILIAALYFGGAFHSGSAVLTQGGVGVSVASWQTRVAIAQLWGVLFAAIGLAWLARRLTWREWLGSGPWKLWWLLVPAALLLVDVGATAIDRHAISVNHPIANWPWQMALVEGAKSIGGMPFVLLVMCAAIPAIEEFVFRGCMLGGLSRHISFGWANVLQATVFSLLHRDPKHFVFLFIFALIAGWMAKKTKGLGMSMVTHAGINAIFVWSVSV